MKVTTVNLGNDHEFIIKEYSLHWFEPFWEAQSKVTRAYAQSGQYHTIMESRVHLTLKKSLWAIRFVTYDSKYYLIRL